MIRTAQTLMKIQNRRSVTATKTALTLPRRFEINSDLFDHVQSRVKQSGSTIEKILITYHDRNGTKKDFLMNRNLSTGYDCAKHINMMIAKRAVLSLVSYPNEEPRLESMNEPFLDRCNFELIDFQTEKYAQDVNQAYWRSCSIVLAAALIKGLKDNIILSELHCEVPKCYFAVDVIGLSSSLSQDDLRDLTFFIRHDIISKNIPFETVTLPSEIAADYGFTSSMKLCRFGDFVTEVDGPVISRSDQIGRFDVVKGVTKEGFTRVGGVSLPSAFVASSYLWETIVENAQDKLS
ncbi:hypothetical protein DICVIV_04207 [Dictyocaulus viviparus]|uniref:TGS domain protein n=1 Tax=Dictyocaulus viviparus TaxID=29172 RepID=A0A0D8Y514_DICVI|nr:hypothetical protein DICVIV_04207 [Dictyocaulus viviparus]